MNNQLFWQNESERRAQRLLREAEADRFARAGRLRRASGGGLGKDILGAIEALLNRREHGGESAEHPALSSVAIDVLVEAGVRGGSGAAVAEVCCDPVAP